jgi:hypothetical protein
MTTFRHAKVLESPSIGPYAANLVDAGTRFAFVTRLTEQYSSHTVASEGWSKR